MSKTISREALGKAVDTCFAQAREELIDWAVEVTEAADEGENDLYLSSTVATSPGGRWATVDLNIEQIPASATRLS